MAMTFDQKEDRRTAQFWGRITASAIKHMRDAQNEANLWRTVDAEAEADWLRRADSYQKDAVDGAEMAAHAARRSLA